jgi:hypothetical protein
MLDMSGIVHGADHGHLPGLHAQRRDDAVDGSPDGGLRQRVAGRVQARARLIHAVLGGLEVRLRRVERGLGLLVVCLGGDLGLVVQAHAVVLPLGLLHRGPRRVTVGEARLQRGARPRLLGGRPVPVDLEEELPLLDVIPLAHGEVDDLPHHQGRKLHLVLGLDLAVRGHLRDDVLLLHLGGDDRDSLAVLALVGGPAPEDHDGRHDEEDDPLSLEHAFRPQRFPARCFRCLRRTEGEVAGARRGKPRT